MLSSASSSTAFAVGSNTNLASRVASNPALVGHGCFSTVRAASGLQSKLERTAALVVVLAPLANLRRRRKTKAAIIRAARIRDSEGRRITEPPIFDASDPAQIKSVMKVEFDKRPFGVTAYAPSENGKGALIWEIGQERYPGDPKGRAAVRGVREGLAVKSVAGVDVSHWLFEDILDVLQDKIFDNSSGKFQSGAQGAASSNQHVSDSSAQGNMGNEPAELPVEIEYVELNPVEAKVVASSSAAQDLEQCWTFKVELGDHVFSYGGSASVDDAYIKRMIDTQKAHAGEVVLTMEDAIKLVEDVIAILKTEDTLERVSFDSVVVVGDLHGQFFDMLRIFDLQGMPSESNPYVFNGDFVDRGQYSLEVIFTLFALKLRFPNAVRLNRGNHEAADLNLKYGFAAEIRARYGPAGRTLFEKFSEAFNWLPLGHVLNSEVIIVHGGLPGPDPRINFKDQGGAGTGYDAQTTKDSAGRSGGRKGGGQNLTLLGYNPDNVSLPPRAKELTLEDLASLPRGIEPVTDFKQLDDLPEDEAETQRLVVDLLWADPRGKTGFGPSYRVRKGCYIFGPDVTEAFLARNGLRLMIRSHEVKSNGYQWTQPKCITVFSAPNYLGHARNKGAVVRLTRDAQSGNLEPSFTTYEAADFVFA